MSPSPGGPDGPLRDGICWLASYPKSGNTWIRALLAAYRRDGPLDLDDLDDVPMASGRDLFHHEVGLDAGDLTPAEAASYRPDLYRRLALTRPPPLLLKVHDAWTRLPDGRPLFPAEATACVLYVLRDPRDVAVSLAHHLGCSFDEAVRHLASPGDVVSSDPGMGHSQLPQRLLSWSGHVTSWVDDSGLDVLVVRYEDLKRDPEGGFAGVLRHLGLAVDPTRVARAVAAASFGRLRAQEERQGFNERSPRAAAFFRRGEAAAWREVLTSAQADSIAHSHRAVMARFGYRPVR